MERINPMVISVDGTEYTLEFSRETVKHAERSGFRRDDIYNQMMNRTEELFFYAFKMHHPKISMEKTNEILYEKLEGLTDEEFNRLIDLFNAPYETVMNESGERKNSKVTVKL